jgi:alkylation response protein AidB-like acyl-CoA dehydrogenase
VGNECLIGEEGTGFKKVLFGMNAERILLAGEALGTGECKEETLMMWETISSDSQKPNHLFD